MGSVLGREENNTSYNTGAAGKLTMQHSGSFSITIGLSMVVSSWHLSAMKKNVTEIGSSLETSS